MSGGGPFVFTSLKNTLYRGISDPSILWKRDATSVSGVILGNPGAGKSSLCNKLCKASLPVDEGERVTYRLDCLRVAYGNCAGFTLLDTPGALADGPYAVHDAILLRTALTSGPINTIFVVIAFDSRLDRMEDDFAKIQNIVSKYKDRTILMVSKMDHSKAPERFFHSLWNRINSKCFGMIGFSNETTDPKSLANEMFKMAKGFKAEHLTMNDIEFLTKFHLRSWDVHANEGFEKAKRRCQEISEELFALYRCCLQDGYNLRERDEMGHFLIVQQKNELQELLDKYAEVYGDGMNEFENYYFWMELKKLIFNLTGQFSRRVQPYISYNFYDNSDPRNCIKRCPHCNTVWMKIEGCDGETNCGSKPSSDRVLDITGKPLFSFSLEWRNNKRIIQKVEKPPATPRRPTVQGQSQGCGRSMVWNSLPPVEDELICELLNVSTMAAAVESFKTSAPGVNQVDTTIHNHF